MSRTEYDDFRNVLMQMDATSAATYFGNYDFFGTPEWTVDPSGTWTENNVDQYGRVNYTLVCDDRTGMSSSCVGGNQLAFTLFEYDVNHGRLTRVIQSNEGGTIRVTTGMVYDDQGRIAIIADPSGRITYFDYDRNGNQVLSFYNWEQPGSPNHP